MTPTVLPPIDWPIVQLGDQRLVVRWTFYTNWLLSKRRIDVRTLGRLIEEKDPGLIDLMVEVFAAAVAENFVSRSIPAPGADYWAAMISTARATDPDVWGRINTAIWAAVGKVPPAAEKAPTLQPAAQTGDSTTTQ